MDSPLLLIATFLAVVFAASFLIDRSSTVSRSCAEDAGRYACLEGLRGVLACAVLVHHASIARHLYAGEPWATPSSALYHLAGDGAVAVFFMVTGFLFWNKALAGRLDFRSLVVSRLRRIVPLQLFALLLVVAICTGLGATGAGAAESRVVRGAFGWLARGFVGAAPIHGVDTLTVDAGVSWTLAIEWLFYLLLVPLAGVCLRPGRFASLAAALLAAIVVFDWAGRSHAAHRLLSASPLLVGMACAYLVPKIAAPQRFTGRPATLAIGLLLGAVLAGYSTATSGWLNLALAPAFLAVVLGNDIFGLLRWKALRWLGRISFGIYLLHGIVLLAVLRAVDRVAPIAAMDPAGYALLIASVGVAVVVVASLAHFGIERAFLDPATLPRQWSRLRTGWRARSPFATR